MGVKLLGAQTSSLRLSLLVPLAQVDDCVRRVHEVLVDSVP